MSPLQKDYNKIHALSKQARILQGVDSLLHWDQETYMPAGAAEIRSEQIKTMAGMIHKMRTSKSFAKALGKLIDIKSGELIQKELKPAQKAALKEWRREFLRNTSLPKIFVEKFASLCSQSIYIWDKAKKENRFELFLPYFEKVVTMCRKKADFIGYQDHPYDALLDEYEPHFTTKQVFGLFSPLKKTIQGLLQKIKAAKQIENSFIATPYDVELQKSFNEILLKAIKFPFEYGRLDFSSHPFSSSAHPTDSRITTRILKEMPMSNIRTILHECGHAFYELGLPKEQYGSPLGDAISLGMHESQSRFWETLIGMSRPFWQAHLPLLKQHFGGKLENVSLDNFWRAFNRVELSLIRVEADEVTYPLHVILRFELEVALIEGSIRPREIPEAWNAKMQELIGIKPKNNSEGCLQDIHWSMGAFGYFPTYSLGNLYASHFFQAFEKKFPDWENQVAAGEISFIKEWLKETIHCHGKLYSSQELLKKVTEKDFSSNAYESYLTKKYTEVYQL